MKHYISVEFLSIFRMSLPSQVQSPPYWKTFWRRFWLEGRKSGKAKSQGGVRRLRDLTTYFCFFCSTTSATWTISESRNCAAPWTACSCISYVTTSRHPCRNRKRPKRRVWTGPAGRLVNPSMFM